MDAEPLPIRVPDIAGYRNNRTARAIYDEILQDGDLTARLLNVLRPMITP
jgi:hypothetical protein